MKKVKKRILIFCEGKTEENYIVNLFRIKEIDQNYCYKIKRETHLKNAIKIEIEEKDNYCFIVFIYDADIVIKEKKNISNFPNNLHIFLTKENFEDFLNLHNHKSYFNKGKKPEFKREFLMKVSRKYKIEDFERMNNKKIKHDNFKTIIDFILKLFKGEI